MMTTGDIALPNEFNAYIIAVQQPVIVQKSYETHTESHQI